MKGKRIKELLLEGQSSQDIMNETGCSKSTITYHAQKLGIHRKKQITGDWKRIRVYYETGKNKSDCLEKFNVTSHMWDAAVRRGDIFIRNEDKRKTLSLQDVLVKNSIFSNTYIKERLLKEGVFEAKCMGCGFSVWQGQDIILQIHHINGDSLDNRLENLALVCPTCHSLTDNYGSKNKKGENIMGPVLIIVPTKKMLHAAENNYLPVIPIGEQA